MVIKLSSTPEIDEDNRAFLQSVEQTQDELTRTRHLGNGVPDTGSAPASGGMITADIDGLGADGPMLRPGLFTPPVDTIVEVPGDYLYHIGPPFDWSYISPGAASCWTGSTLTQKADKTRGEIALGVCNPGNIPADEAEARIGMIIDDTAGVGGRVKIGWLMATKLSWQFQQANQNNSVTSVFSLNWELWEWDGSAIASQVFWGRLHGGLYTFLDTRSPLAGSVSDAMPNVATQYADCVIPLPKGNGPRKYLAALNLWMNVTNGPGAIESRVWTTPWY